MHTVSPTGGTDDDASKCAEVEKTTGADENGKPTTLWMFDASDREAKKTK